MVQKKKMFSAASPAHGGQLVLRSEELLRRVVVEPFNPGSAEAKGEGVTRQSPSQGRRSRIMLKKKLITLLAVVGMVLGLTSSAQAATKNSWLDGPTGPLAVDQYWSNPLNWSLGHVPTAGEQAGFEFLPSSDFTTLTGGWVIMDADTTVKSAFWGSNLAVSPPGLSIEAHLTVTADINPGENFDVIEGPVRITPGGTLDAASVMLRKGGVPSYLDVTGGDLIADRLFFSHAWGMAGVLRVSSDAGNITLGHIEVSGDHAQVPEFDFVFAAGGVTPIEVTESDPLQFLGDTQPTPFQLSVNTTNYTGAEFSIPLFTFTGGTDTDRMFADPGNITITQTTPGEWWVTQSDTGVTLDRIPEPATMALLALGGLGVLLRRRSRKA